MKNKIKQRQHRVRQKIRYGGRHRKLTVFRSNRHVWAQIVDLATGKTLAAFSTKALFKLPKYRGKKISRQKAARLAGQLLAKKATAQGIKQVVFDRGGYVYHGRVRSLAEGARAGGLKF